MRKCPLRYLYSDVMCDEVLLCARKQYAGPYRLLYVQLAHVSYFKQKDQQHTAF